MIYQSCFRGDAIFSIKKYLNSITMKNDAVWHHNMRLDLNEVLLHEDTTSIYIKSFMEYDMWFFMDLIRCIMYKLNITKKLCLLIRVPAYVYHNDKLEKNINGFDINEMKIGGKTYHVAATYNDNNRVLERLEIISNILNDIELFIKILDERDEAYFYKIATDILIKNDQLLNQECKTILIQHAAKYCEFGDEIGL